MNIGTISEYVCHALEAIGLKEFLATGPDGSTLNQRMGVPRKYAFYLEYTLEVPHMDSLPDALLPLFKAIKDSPEVKSMLKSRDDKIVELEKKQDFLAKEVERLEQYETYYKLARCMAHDKNIGEVR